MMNKILTLIFSVYLTSSLASELCQFKLDSESFSINIKNDVIDQINYFPVERDFELELEAGQYQERVDHKNIVSYRSDGFIADQLLHAPGKINQIVKRTLLGNPIFKKLLNSTTSDKIYIINEVQKIPAGHIPGHFGSPEWHTDGGFYTITNRDFRSRFPQIFLLLHEKDLAVTPTQFLTSNNSLELKNWLLDNVDFHDGLNQKNIAILDLLSERLAREKDLKTHLLQNGQVILTTSSAIHRRTTSLFSGYRYFLRMDFHP